MNHEANSKLKIYALNLKLKSNCAKRPTTRSFARGPDSIVPQTVSAILKVIDKEKTMNTMARYCFQEIKEDFVDHWDVYSYFAIQLKGMGWQCSGYQGRPEGQARNKGKSCDGTMMMLLCVLSCIGEIIVNAIMVVIIEVERQSWNQSM